jgi:acyl dehydratase
MTLQETLPFDAPERISKYSTGDTWSGWGATRVVTTRDIREFAKLTGNHQWIHDDANRCASESPYGKLIAHGLLLVALIPSLLPQETFTLVGHRVRIIRAIDHLRLPSPVYPGDTIHARLRRLKTYAAPSGKGTVVEREVEVWSQSGTKPAVTCTLKMQYF